MLPMAHLIVDDAQAEMIAQSNEPIEIRDRQGNHLGYVAKSFTPEELDLAKTRQTSNDPRYSTAEVLNHLRSLDAK